MMAIRLHTKEEAPQPAAAVERPRVSRTRGFPRFLLFLLVVVAGAIGIWYGVTHDKVQCRGRVTAALDEFVPEGRCRIVMIRDGLEVGETAPKGEVLVASESIDPRSRIATYAAALKTAEHRLALAGEGGDVGEVDLAKRSARLSVAERDAGISKAKYEAAQKSEKQFEDLVKVIAADRAKEIEKASADRKTALERLQQAKAAEKEVAVELAQAERNLNTAKALRAEDAITPNDFETAQTRVAFFGAGMEKARAATAEGQASLDANVKVLQAIKDKYDAELEAQKSRLLRAQADTKAAETSWQLNRKYYEDALKKYGGLAVSAEEIKKMKQKEQDLLAARVDEAAGDLAYYRRLAGEAKFASPFDDGVVSELSKKVGDTAEMGEKVIAVYSPKTIAVEVYVPEDDFYRVLVGQDAEVRILGTKVKFTGKVVNVNTAPSRLPGIMKRTADPERAYDRFYTCRISVPDDVRGRIRPEMRTNVTIYVD